MSSSSGSAARPASLLHRVGYDPADPPELALQKRVLVAVASLVAMAGVLWGAIYFSFDEAGAGAIPMGYSILSMISLGLFALTRRYVLFRTTQLLLILVLPFALQLALGGFVASSAVILWAFLAPVGGMLMMNRRAGTVLFAGFLLLVVLAQVLQPELSFDNSLPTWLIGVFFVMNVGTVAAVVFGTIHYFEGQKEQAQALLVEEQRRSEQLLLNVLPTEVAAELKQDGQTAARHFDDVSILFADIVGFTSLTSAMGPDELVDLLNDVFLHFDDLVDRYRCEKIRTIGDNYMVAAGVPTPHPDHAVALVDMALEMLDFSATLSTMSFRIGIDTGPVVAGVIGRSKFQYDLWGDSVNTASRMESQGEPGRVQITEATYERVKDTFECIPRGVIPVKGMGEMATWFVSGRRTPS